MDYIFDLNNSRLYKKWAEDTANAKLIAKHIDIAFNMLNPTPESSILDIGCKLGYNLEFFIKKGLNATGVETSPYLIDFALQRIKNKADIHKSEFEELPFEDNSFDYSTLITTLEFSKNPIKTIEEACRVTKDKIFIGILNKYAVKNIERKIKGIFSDTIYKKARFFAIWEINNIIKSLMGDIPITWKTSYQSLPIIKEASLKNESLENILRKNPFAAFAGITAILKPTFRTTPLKLKRLTKQIAGI
jgi:ubiquinone/menaquinone biosynthesis C-methylase UbiE